VDFLDAGAYGLFADGRPLFANGQQTVRAAAQSAL